MEVVNARSALLSNFEVLTLLKEHESDLLARQKTALRIKKEEDASGVPSYHINVDEAGENLRTVEFEAISYLSADYQPLNTQSEGGIQKLVKELAPYSLTKAEKLQIVNLAPQDPVELYVIVEEMEDRLIEGEMETILGFVSDSFTKSPDAPALSAPMGIVEVSEQQYDPQYYEENWGEPDADEFDDNGEGAGVEGDLEQDEE